MNKIWSGVKSFPSGALKLFSETKMVLKLKFGEDSYNLKRKDLELIRTNYCAWKKMSLLLVTQAIPLVGNIPLFLAFKYPKQMLTNHFWTEEQEQLFMMEDFASRHYHSVKLLKSTNLLEIDQLDKFVHNFLNVSVSNNLSNCDKDELRCLAGANLVCPNFLLNYTHSFILRKRLYKLANYIIDDDAKLRNLCDESLKADDMSLKEWKVAAFNRGINPNQPLEVIIYYINEWLECALLNKERVLFTNSSSPKSEKLRSVLIILYSISYNSLRTFQSK